MIGIAVLAFFLCALNIIFWLIFLKKFKNLFSTRDIIGEARLEMKAMIEDVNRITSRNIDIIEEKIQKLKSAAAEADRHIQVAKNDLDKHFQLRQYSQILRNKESPSVPVKNAAQVYERLSDGLNSNKAYSITTEGKKMVDGEQGDLFDQDEQTTFINSPSGTKFTVDTQGNSVAAIPKLGPNIHFSDNPVEPKKTINEQILELHRKGYTVEMIARELELTTTEVQLSLNIWQ